MASPFAILVAAIFHLGLEVCFFFVPPKDNCSPAPALATHIFVVAALQVIADMKLYPRDYLYLPFIVQIICETMAAILLTEFSTIIVWCSIERGTSVLLKFFFLLMGVSLKTYMKWQYFLLGLVTCAIALSILTIVGVATDRFYLIRRKFGRIDRLVRLNVAKLLAQEEAAPMQYQIQPQPELPTYRRYHTRQYAAATPRRARRYR